MAETRLRRAVKAKILVDILKFFGWWSREWVGEKRALVGTRLLTISIKVTKYDYLHVKKTRVAAMR